MTSDTSRLPEGVPAPQANDRIARALRGFGPPGLLAMLVIAVSITPALRAVLVLAWAWRSHTPWREIGYVRPRSWTRSLVIGLSAGAALKIVMKAIAMPLLGAPPTNSAYHFLVGNAAAIPVAVFAAIVGAGFGEETVFRGYLFERMRKVLGAGVGASTAIVVLTSVLFGLAHFPEQRLAGAEQGLITGLVFGTIFAATGRLFTVMCMHAAFDLTAVAIIYWNLESVVARAVFR